MSNISQKLTARFLRSVLRVVSFLPKHNTKSSKSIPLRENPIATPHDKVTSSNPIEAKPRSAVEILVKATSSSICSIPATTTSTVDTLMVLGTCAEDSWCLHQFPKDLVTGDSYKGSNRGITKPIRPTDPEGINGRTCITSRSMMQIVGKCGHLLVEVAIRRDLSNKLQEPPSEHVSPSQDIYDLVEYLGPPKHSL